MAQASSRWWQQLSNQIERVSLADLKLDNLKQFPIPRLEGIGSWLIGIVGLVVMLFWQGKLLLSTSIGVLVMLLIYQMQSWNWQAIWLELREFFGGANRQLTLAVLSGAIATLSTYMAVSIWLNASNPWLALGSILQGFGTLTVLLLLGWQVLSRQISRDEAYFNRLLADLTHTNTLKRLIAVRQITRIALDPRFERLRQGTMYWGQPVSSERFSGRSQVAEYFRLMLGQESEASVREAVLDGLQRLDDAQKLNQATQPAMHPTAIKRTAARVQRKVAES